MNDTNEARAEIVVGMDESPFAAAALRWAVDIATQLNYGLRVVHAWNFDPMGDLTAAAAGSAMAYREERRDRIEEAVRWVHDLAQSPVVIIDLVEGPPARALAEASREARMVVLGSHGRRGVLRLMVGSVTEQCLRTAHCPVVVIPPEMTAHRDKAPAAIPAPFFDPGPLL